MSDAETAALEAFEEAGIVGDIESESVGHYHYDKRRADGDVVQCGVAVFPMTVAELLDDWPERGQRQRCWFTLTEAAERVAEPELTALLLKLARIPGRGPLRR